MSRLCVAAFIFSMGEYWPLSSMILGKGVQQGYMLDEYILYNSDNSHIITHFCWINMVFLALPFMHFRSSVCSNSQSAYLQYVALILTHNEFKIAMSGLLSPPAIRLKGLWILYLVRIKHCNFNIIAWLTDLYNPFLKITQSIRLMGLHGYFNLGHWTHTLSCQANSL